jgi:hypothetical protein
MIISSLPRQLLESPEQLGALITEQLAQGVNPDNLTDDALRSLDERVILEAETLGQRIFTSRLVQARVQAWEWQPGGIERNERLGKALAKYGRIMQRQELPPIDPGIRQHKQETVNELRLASRAFRQQYTKLRKTPTQAELLKMFRQVLAGGGGVFPYLTANLDSWVLFFEQEKDTVSRALSTSRFPAAEIYDQWLAWATGYKQEALRQKIATLKQ